MADATSELRTLGIQVPDILVPKKEIDLKKWAVVACDQYTSQRTYWEEVEAYVGSAPSTLRLIFPEVYLEDGDEAERIASLKAHMHTYLQQELFVEYPKSLFLIHRQVGPGVGRWGLLVALDLEEYDCRASSRSLIRATEGTILSRIPPRKLIRHDAPLEIPHTLVLMNDFQRLVIEPLVAAKEHFPLVYQTELMFGGGSVTAYQLSGEENFAALSLAFRKLYGALDHTNALLFAMGDGNHSFATAKSCWEDLKKQLSESEQKNHPARFSLVELENIYDPGLVFEPIHRVLFGLSRQRFFEHLKEQCTSFESTVIENRTHLLATISQKDDTQRFGFVDAEGLLVVTLHNSNSTLAVGALQHVIDSLVADGEATVDYIHGDDVTETLGRQPNNIGLFFSAIAKETFFESLIAEGVLPRKTFSMGEAHEKRYYLEARRL